MVLNQMVIIPIIVAICELAKGLGLPKKFTALLALIIGIVIGIFYLGEGDIKQGILEGVIYGLTSVGLYSGTKNIIQKAKDADG